MWITILYTYNISYCAYYISIKRKVWDMQSWAINNSMSACSVAKLYPTLCDPMYYSLPDSSDHGISQARILEWFAIPLQLITAPSYNSLMTKKKILIWTLFISNEARSEIGRTRWFQAIYISSFCYHTHYSVVFLRILNLDTFVSKTTFEHFISLYFFCSRLS